MKSPIPLSSKKLKEDLQHSRKLQLSIVALAVACLLPLLDGTGYMTSEVLTPIVIFAIYASAWNLLAYSGQASLGHAAFLGIGGFVSALIGVKLGLPPLLGLFVGAAFSALIGLLIGLACVRLKTWFLAIVTFGFSVIAIAVFTQFDNELGGILGFAPKTIVPTGLPLYYVAFAFSVASILVIYRVMKSKWGLAFQAIHQNEQEARMIGINVAKYRLLAFVLSTFFAGLAGGLYVQYTSYVDISIFNLEHSLAPLMMAIVGGLMTIEGPIIGAVIIVALESYLPMLDSTLRTNVGFLFPSVSNVGPYLTALGLGLFFVVMVIFVPKGITSLIPKLYALIMGKDKPKEEKKDEGNRQLR
ncbi:MAG: branched-chain amino acid ABC transporter permease [Candidatus Bathyarchaeota archaeon]|nr:branched-chain amino acid ABC transporter permease [Candidatus Bathyarchaeota archaeon]